MKYLSAILLLSCSTVCHAVPDVWLDVPLASKHFNDTYKGQNGDIPFNSSNAGIGLSMELTPRTDVGVGTYHNSYYNQSNYAALDFHTLTSNYWRVGVTVGVVTGYTKTMLMVVPHLSIVTSNYKLSMGVTPTKNSALVVSMGIKF